MKLLVIRHGQTDWNVLGKIQGQTDIELNEIGIEQAKQVKQKLWNTPIDIIISSPLKRTKQTAEIIREGREIPLMFSNEIIERNFGEFEGKTREQMDLDEVWNPILNKQYERAESVQMTLNRVYHFLDELKIKYVDKTVLLVIHGGIAIPIRCYFEGIPEKINTLRHMGIDNCEVLEYTIE